MSTLRDPVFEATYGVVEKLILRQPPEAWQEVKQQVLAQSTETGQQAVQELMLKQTAATWQDPLASDGTSMPLLGSLFWMWNEPLIGSIGTNRRGGMWSSALWHKQPYTCLSDHLRPHHLRALICSPPLTLTVNGLCPRAARLLTHAAPLSLSCTPAIR